MTMKTVTPQTKLAEQVRMLTKLYWRSTHICQRLSRFIWEASTEVTIIRRTKHKNLQARD
uniref:Uncharacterized protein n=1 Tax=Rhizophora mucronata TaxID=61149 RepID=A0A2P2QQG1_RHIMU